MNEKVFTQYEFIMEAEGGNEVGLLVDDKTITDREYSYDWEGNNLVIEAFVDRYVFKSVSDSMKRFIELYSEVLLVHVDNEEVYTAKSRS